MHAANQLRLETNPFTASANGARIGRPLQAALGEVIRQIGLEAPVIVVCGSAGAGKTLLMHMIARACTDMGLCARQIDRGDLMHVAFGQCADVLLVDEADSIADSTLHTLVSAGANASTTTMIFLCLPSNARRFTSSGGRAVIIELTPLTRSDSRNYLLERATSAGRPELFEADALDLLIEGARGSPRVLRSIASLAFFAAAVDGSGRIGTKHVADALASQIHCEAPKFEQAPIPAAPRVEIPTPKPIVAAPIAAAPIIAAPISKPAPAPAPAPALPALASDPPPSDTPAPDVTTFMPEIAEIRKKFGAARPQSVVWMPRLVGVAAALVASIAIAEGLPSLLFSSIPSSANASNRPPAETLVVRRLGFASVVPAPPAATPKETPSKAETAKQTADIAKALKGAAAAEIKPLASAVPARKPVPDQVQTAKKPAAKDPNDTATQTKAANEAAYLKNVLAAKEAADRAAALAALKAPAAPPAPVLELANPAPAQKEVAAITQPTPKQEDAAPQVPAPQIMAVLPPAAKQKEADDRARAEERELARGREAVLAKVAADRALAAKQAEERAWETKQAANRESMRALANSLRGLGR